MPLKKKIVVFGLGMALLVGSSAMAEEPTLDSGTGKVATSPNTIAEETTTPATPAQGRTCAAAEYKQNCAVAGGAVAADPQNCCVYLFQCAQDDSNYPDGCWDSLKMTWFSNVQCRNGIDVNNCASQEPSSPVCPIVSCPEVNCPSTTCPKTSGGNVIVTGVDRFYEADESALVAKAIAATLGHNPMPQKSPFTASVIAGFSFVDNPMQQYALDSKANGYDAFSAGNWVLAKEYAGETWDFVYYLDAAYEGLCRWPCFERSASYEQASLALGITDMAPLFGGMFQFNLSTGAGLRDQSMTNLEKEHRFGESKMAFSYRYFDHEINLTLQAVCHTWWEVCTSPGRPANQSDFLSPPFMILERLRGEFAWNWRNLYFNDWLFDFEPYIAQSWAWGPEVDTKFYERNEKESGARLHRLYNKYEFLAEMAYTLQIEEGPFGNQARVFYKQFGINTLYHLQDDLAAGSKVLVRSVMEQTENDRSYHGGEMSFYAVFLW